MFSEIKIKVHLPKKTNSNNQLRVKMTPKKKVKKKPCTWDSNFMKAAKEAVTNNEMNVTEALEVFNIPRQTLGDRIKNKFGKEGACCNTELTPDEEQVLINYCLFMAKSSYPLSVSQIKAFAWAIVCKSARKSQLTKPQALAGNGGEDFVIDIQK